MRLRLLSLLVALALFLEAAPAAAAEESEAERLAADAEVARAAGLFERCIEKDEASLTLEPAMATRVHLAGCAASASRIVLALQQLKIVLEDAIEQKDAEVAELAEQRTHQLLQRLGVVVIELPAGATDVTATVDGSPLEPEGFANITVDPGSHRLRVDGTVGGVRGRFETIVAVEEAGRVRVPVILTPESEHLTAGQLECMRAAKTDDEAFRCLPGRDKALVIRAALEMNVYQDDFSVNVLNPAVRANVASPTRGFSVGASYLVDVISAASPDFVSTASPTGHDVRHAVAVNGSYKPSRIGIEAAGGYSTESDYFSRSGGIALLADVLDRRVTPRIGWNISSDIIGRGGTPTAFFKNELLSNEAVASASIVASPRTLVILGATLGFERGDQSKPYRLIPMFAPGVEVGAGASPNEVNAKRLPARPYEQLPLERDRWAAGARLVRRLGSSTLRLEERLYADTWDNRASSTDARWLYDASSRLTVGPHARFHAQTGASFFRRVYHADVGSVVTVPSLRTTDRELGPLYAVTGGGSLWWKLLADDQPFALTLYASGDALYSRYLDSLYVSQRIAVYGTLGVEGVFE